jgi:hypothetical protein
MISTIFSDLSLFFVLNYTITYEHKLNSSLFISPCHNHKVIMSTAYTKYSIIPRSTVSSSQPVSHLSADVVVRKSLPSHNYKSTNEWRLSCRPISRQIDHLQVLLKSPLIISCKCISKLSPSPPQCASLSSLNLGLQVQVHTFNHSQPVHLRVH